jgi:hypothetical protein
MFAQKIERFAGTLCSHETQQSTGQARGIRIPEPCAVDR